MNEADQTLDEGARADLVHQIAGFLAEDSVMLPLFQFPNIAAWRTDTLSGPIAQDAGNYQAFQNIYRTDALDVNQRLRITSLTVLFSDLKGSTELYERVGDLVAYDLVQSHFRALNQAIAMESGAVVKTIGDAVMATFPTPDRGLAAALRMRDALRGVSDARSGDLTVKIGLHEGPCLAVMLNERLDYFGQTVNIAARVQGLCQSRSIFATRPVVEEPQAARLLSAMGVTPIALAAE